MANVPPKGGLQTSPHRKVQIVLGFPVQIDGAVDLADARAARQGLFRL